MIEKPKKPIRSVLGRGLSSLISSTPVAVAPHRMNVEKPAFSRPTEHGNLAKDLDSENSKNEAVAYVNIELVTNNPSQPRQNFEQKELDELADSIKSLGVLQPILVRPTSSVTSSVSKYEIVAGERRWRAAKLAKCQQVPVIIHEINDTQALEIALVENIQRASLNPIEEAQAYERLMNEFNLAQKDVAERVGKDRASIANIMRLLKLPQEVQSWLAKGTITSGHAKAILTVREPSAQISLAKKVISENLSVRALESIVSRVVVLDGSKPNLKQTTNRKASIESSFPEVVDRIRNALGTKVSIRHKKVGSGKIEIEYFSEQELERIVDYICKN